MKEASVPHGIEGLSYVQEIRAGQYCLLEASVNCFNETSQPQLLPYLCGNPNRASRSRPCAFF